MKAWPKPSLLHVHAPWNCISDHCILRQTMCILTCAHRGARPGTRTPGLVYTCTNCMKPQLDIHGVPTLTISSIAGWPICAVAVGTSIDFHTPRQKSSPTYCANVYLRCVQFFSFFSLFFFYSFLCLAHWKLFARDMIILQF